MSLKIVFMGTPEFAKELLEHLYKKQKYTIKAVYTQPPKKSHRGQQLNLSPVHKFAQEKKIDVFCPTKFSNEEIDILKKIDPDVILVAAYGLILPGEILKIPGCGSVNVHASLLPKWRGAAPIQRSIMNGDEKTGISIMKIVDQLDAGPTYLQSEVKIRRNDTYENVYNSLVELGKSSLDIYFAEHKPFLPMPQDHKLATYAKKIEKKETQINFEDSAFIAHKKICAFSPKPGAWFLLNSYKYKIFDTEVIKEEKINSLNKSKNLIFPFKEDYLIAKKIQKEGKNIMSIEDFEKGYSRELEIIRNKFSKNIN